MMTEVVIVGGFILPLLMGSTGVAILGLTLGVLSVNEIASLQRWRLQPRLLLVVGGVAAFWAMTLLSAPLRLAVAAAMMVLLMTPLTRARMPIIALYPILFASFLTGLFDLREGVGLIVLTYLVTESCDSFALLIGKLIGRHRPFKASPNKTIEGVAAGIVISATLGAIAGVYLGMSIPVAAAVSLLLACTTVVGDLAASRIKRFHGVKDFGNVLPLQGGVLDIYDSTLFNLPIAFLIFSLARGIG